MTDKAISVKNITKAYRIGMQKEKDETIFSAFLSMLRAPVQNYRRLKKLANVKQDEGTQDVFIALQDISFEVGKGEVTGIIGHNGAGKSTLLKILARITEPTDGQVILNGRVSSLLEVGTGFNPELTGRENIYLNGTILGMTKKEIDKKLDEIISFSGIPKFIDTPVKRYSSGMKVRLAFAVAANLDPEILLIDEVLAVGDVAFQKKCLGKMRDVSTSGRTILFVSHDMGAIQSLCHRCILLKEGKVIFDGDTQSAVSRYLSGFDTPNDNLLLRKDRAGNGRVLLTAFSMYDLESRPVDVVHSGQKVAFILTYTNQSGEEFSGRNLIFSISFSNEVGVKLFHLTSRYSDTIPSVIPPSGSIQCVVSNFPLLPGKYWVSISCKDDNTVLDFVENAVELTVVSGYFPGYLRLPNNNAGPFLLQHYWTTEISIVSAAVRGE